MAAEKSFDDALLDEDAKYFAETGGNIRCRGDGTVRHFLRTTEQQPGAHSEVLTSMQTAHMFLCSAKETHDVLRAREHLTHAISLLMEQRS